MSKELRHVRHHAKRHHEAHSRLKTLLALPFYGERVWGVFLSTFVMAVLTIALFLNWGNISSFFGATSHEDDTQEESLNVIGYQKGVVTSYQVNGQSADQYIRLVRQIDGQGHMIGLETSNVIGKAQEEENQNRQSAFMGSVFFSTDLSKGHHLTDVRGGGRMLQKSILTTFYLGEKTVDLHSTIQTDSELLSKISNALAVDIFAYLNQSADRATTLDNYLNLLEILLQTARDRSTELQSKINFLTQNFEAQDRTITLTEGAFFENLSIFDGENADTQLAQFIGLQQDQSEVRAKIGAYNGLHGYYAFFIPQLDNLIRAIQANRDALIAGVKVTEIQNMTLPLIIRER